MERKRQTAGIPAAPKSFAVTHLEMDVRPGGAWRKSMRSSDGREASNGGILTDAQRVGDGAVVDVVGNALAEVTG